MSIQERNQPQPARALFPILQSPPPPARTFGFRRLAALGILVAGAVVPAVIAALSTPPPQTRDIHIEAYRYGFSPARIHVNRGDRLRLTFSTRDTGASFFLQDYDLHAAITPGETRVSVQRLSRPNDPPVVMETIELTAGRPGWQGWLVSKSQFRNHTYNGPLHGTERGELIVVPNLLLWGALGLLFALPFALLLLDGAAPTAEPAGRRINLFQHFPRLKRMMKAPNFQFDLIVPMLAVFWFIVLAGLFGTKVAGRNAAPMIIWVVWLSALIIVLVPIFGRSWCTVCPLPLMGEWMQRLRFTRNPHAMQNRIPLRIFGVPLVWPTWMSSAWPRVLLFLLLGTFSTTIVVLPPATSWMLIAMVAMATLVSFFPDQRLFCRHLCPINSYISLYSTTGRVVVRSISGETCTACDERFCLTGSVKGWGCPYGLCVGEIDRNNDCGACMECVKTCAYDNVAVFWRTSGWDKEVATFSEAWQAIVMFALACLYSFINLGTWDRLRDWIDLVDKRNWGSFTLYAIAVWTVCLGLLPLLWYLLTRAGKAIGRVPIATGLLFRATTAALIPIGLGCWIAFALTTVLEMMTFVLQSLSDPFNWGWNLLGMAGLPWHIIWAPAIPWLQVISVVTGAAFSLRAIVECWRPVAPGGRRAFLSAVPLAAFLWCAGAGMTLFFAG